jgi:hypothetical protein
MVRASMPVAGVKGLSAWGEGVRGRSSPLLLLVVGDESPVLPVALGASLRR